MSRTTRRGKGMLPAGGKEESMWNLRKTWKSKCGKADGWLESAMAGGPAATTLEELLLALAEGDRQHVQECPECRSACEEFLESRALLAPLRGAQVQPGPFFVNRVLAAIRARETELDRAARAWAMVPRLASRLAGLAVLVLVLEGAWAYERSGRRPAVEPSMEPGNAIFEDNSSMPTTKDEVLVSVLERGQ